MTDNTNTEAGRGRETSAARRWWASAAGLAAFLVSICVCSYLVVLLLHIGPVETSHFDPTKPLDSKPDPGINALAVIAWAASGFLSALLAGLVARLVAPDTSPETFRPILIAGLVVLVGGSWAVSLAAYGFDLLIAGRAAVVLLGGIYGIGKAV